ncbi:hypothetical protein [Limosilactobacillus coleohominis]|uniref:hypothetical protein n=1 Tax=Limosilactobacillus coleohominis TaxID=181675 RepID=UPI002A914D0D|nr:hypothetical protein [Limosilactobacillus coleohominis]MDY5629015.1 hypothetical protein [Limosilactobacillus coleohominis]
MTDKKKISVFLTEAEKQRLKEQAELEGRSMASQARVSILKNLGPETAAPSSILNSKSQIDGK